MSDQPISFITGATGFVGAAVARILEAKGHHLRLLCRPGNDRRNLKGLTNYEVIDGDLGDSSTYTESLNGCDYLFHVAADYRIWVPDEAAMNLINVDGTIALMKAAHQAGVEKIVYTSSVATLGIPSGGRSGDEQTPVALEAMVGVYKRSKYLAEEAVLNLIKDVGLPAVIVNPSTPIGPRDIRPTPTGRIILESAMGRIPAYVDTGLNVAHVDDVAMGHWLALEKGKIGEKYVLGGENLELGDILAQVAGLTDQKPPTIRIPRLPLYPLAYMAELIAHFTKNEPFITVDGLKMSKKKMFFSSQKAIYNLGYAPRPAHEAIRDAVSWFKRNKYF